LYNTAADGDEYDNFYGAVTQHIPLQERLNKSHHVSEIRSLKIVCFEHACRVYGRWNAVPAPQLGSRKQVFDFHTTEKTRSPKQVFHFRTVRSP